MNPPDPCPGPGRCHGCLKWCSQCGDVDQTCDAREQGDRCDEHPPLPSDEELLNAMQGATTWCNVAAHRAETPPGFARAFFQANP